jgi:hypothetical protein
VACGPAWVAQDRSRPSTRTPTHKEQHTMKITFDLDEDRLAELFQRFIKAKNRADPINPLSIIFTRWNQDNDVPEPTLYFYPDWNFEFEISIPLTLALQEFIEENNGDEDQYDLAARLLATTNEWIKEQIEKDNEWDRQQKEKGARDETSTKEP